MDGVSNTHVQMPAHSVLEIEGTVDGPLALNQPSWAVGVDVNFAESPP